MTTYYVGIGGNNGNSGLDWANRKATLNGAEDVPVAAGDTVYVGPGAYRELLTVDVSGGAGSLITYIGDVTGEHTDGVGGLVRVTGSDNDQSATRASCITATSRDYRTFRGFCFDTTTGIIVTLLTSISHWIIEDCVFQAIRNAATINVNAGTQADIIIRRCLFLGSTASNSNNIIFQHSGTIDNTNHLVENCVFICGDASVLSSRIGNYTVKNCTFYGGAHGVYSNVNPAAGQTVTVNNCIFYGISGIAVRSAGAGFVVENYNTFFGNGSDRGTVSVGGNSVTYPPLFNYPLMLDGINYPWFFTTLSKWSQVARITGTGESSDDIFGIDRPATASKKSWGAVQIKPGLRETTTVKDASAASIKLADAGSHQIFVPATNVSTTISVYVYREADYAGTNPRMVIKQPGQADRTTTDTGDAGEWNLLTDSFTPAASPGYVIVELQSLNTAAAGDYDTFFEDLSAA